MNSYYLMYKNEQLSKQYISLLAQIFIKEMEKEQNNSPILISKIIQIHQILKIKSNSPHFYISNAMKLHICHVGIISN